MEEVVTKDNLTRTGYCGLYCAGCVVGTGSLSSKAEVLRDELDGMRFAQIADGLPIDEFQKHREFSVVLDTLAKLKCEGCRGKDRSKTCDIALCAIDKGFAGCWECADFSTCIELRSLEHGHGSAHLKNLEAIRDSGIEDWVDSGPRWYCE